MILLENNDIVAVDIDSNERTYICNAQGKFRSGQELNTDGNIVSVARYINGKKEYLFVSDKIEHSKFIKKDNKMPNILGIINPSDGRNR